MKIEAKQRLTSTKVTAHLRELDGIIDSQSQARLLKLEHHGTFTNVEVGNPEWVVLTFVPFGKSKTSKAHGLDINGLAAMVQALHGLLAIVTPAKAGFNIEIKV